jgi:hypothetical protein
MMLKRQRRRQDENRVKDKFRRVAKKFAGDEGSWDHPNLLHEGIRSPGGAARHRWIAETAVRMAHHPAHQCQMCHLDPKEEKRRRKREVARKAPFIDE